MFRKYLSLFSKIACFLSYVKKETCVIYGQINPLNYTIRVEQLVPLLELFLAKPIEACFIGLLA